MQFKFFFACGALFSVLLSLFSLFRSSFVPLLGSSDFSVPLSFLFSVLLFAPHVLDGGVFRSIGNFVFLTFRLIASFSLFEDEEEEGKI